MGQTGTKQPSLTERLATAKATGRLRLLLGDDLEKILSNPELRNLKALDLSKCNLNVLPYAIGTNLTKLQQIKLNDNPLLQNLPTELIGLTELRKLDCSGCSKLNSLEVLPNCIEILELHSCNFEG